MKKLAFETKDVNGNPLKLEVRLPTATEKSKARVIHAKTWRESATSGSILRNELDEFLKSRGLWGQAQQDKYDELGKQIRDKLLRLKQGGNAGLTRKTGPALALEVMKLRSERNDIVAERNSADTNTAESIADQSQFNYLVSACTLYSSEAGVLAGKPYYSSYDNFVERSDETSAYDSSMKLYELQSKVADTTEGGEEDSDLPEVKFLKEHGFADDKGRLINKDGKLIDENGRLINQDNRYVNEYGELTDVEGRLVDDKGNWLVESSPLLDDEE